MNNLVVVVIVERDKAARRFSFKRISSLVTTGVGGLPVRPGSTPWQRAKSQKNKVPDPEIPFFVVRRPSFPRFLPTRALNARKERWASAKEREGNNHEIHFGRPPQ
jgi:hypothetical protein